MRAVSLFSGVGGFEIGFDRAGIETVLQVDLFDAMHLTDAQLSEPCDQPEKRHRNRTCEQNAEKERRDLTRYGGCLGGVLERHWPETERVNDVRDVARDGSLRVAGRRTSDGAVAAGEATDRVDLIYGGFPCQDLSVAGKRAGLGGSRSALWYEFERVLRELRPRWTVIENVPGLLSSNGGADFAIVLHALGELGYRVGWAVLDAQHFGVPQRRRRVFVVAGPRRRSVEQVLSLCEGCGGNPETGRAAGKDVACALAASVRGTGDGHGSAWNSNYVANPLGSHHRRDDFDHDTYVASPVGASAGHHGHSSPRGGGADNLVADTLREHPRPGSNSTGAFYVPEIVGQAVSAKWAKGSSGPADDEVQNMVGAEGGVRRLTPRECERLQGWPDDWTRWTADGHEIANSHRYRMIGNGVASPVAEWIGHRLVAVDRVLAEA